MKILVKANLTVQPAKTEIYSTGWPTAIQVDTQPPAHLAPPGTFETPPQEVKEAVRDRWRHDGITVAGTPIGNAEYRTKAVIEKVKKMVEVLGYVNEYASDSSLPHSKHGAMVL